MTHRAGPHCAMCGEPLPKGSYTELADHLIEVHGFPEKETRQQAEIAAVHQIMGVGPNEMFGSP